MDCGLIELMLRRRCMNEMNRQKIKIIRTSEVKVLWRGFHFMVCALKCTMSYMQVAMKVQPWCAIIAKFIYFFLNKNKKPPDLQSATGRKSDIRHRAKTKSDVTLRWRKIALYVRSRVSQVSGYATCLWFPRPFGLIMVFIEKNKIQIK